MADQPPPSLSVTIGESIFAAIDRLPGLVDTGVLHDNSSIMIDRPTQVTVIAGGATLALPPTRFVAIGQVAGVVTNVGLAPMLRYADLATTRTLAIRLIDAATASGWTVSERNSLDLARMTAALSRPNRERFGLTAAILRRGDAELRIELKESSGLGLAGRSPPARGNLFLVNTDFTNLALEDRQTQLLFARRAAAQVGTNSLPLDTWRVSAPPPPR